MDLKLNDLQENIYGPQQINSDGFFTFPVMQVSEQELATFIININNDTTAISHSINFIVE